MKVSGLDKGREGDGRRNCGYSHEPASLLATWITGETGWFQPKGHNAR